MEKNIYKGPKPTMFRVRPIKVTWAIVDKSRNGEIVLSYSDKESAEYMKKHYFTEDKYEVKTNDV
jgi:hypothetical protein